MVGYSRDEEVQSTSNKTLIDMQYEALHPHRIERVKTSDSKENRRDYVPSAFIQRRIEKAGTEENRVAQGEARQKLTAWNTAWTALQDDGTVTEDVDNVNEGLGQTHRGKLQADDSVRDYTGEEFYYRGGYRGGRGVHHGSRGVVGRGQGGGRQAATERPAPVKRTRVVKGSGPSHVPMMQPPLELKTSGRRHPAPPVSPGRLDLSHYQVSLTRPQPSTSFLRQPSLRSSEVSDPEPIKKLANHEGNLATPDDFMASILRRKGPSATTPDASKPQVGDAAPPKRVTIANDPNVTKADVRGLPPKVIAVAHGLHNPKSQREPVALNHDSSAPAPLPSAQTDLLDVDIGEEGPHQTVIDFTHSADSKAPGGLSVKQLELLQNLRLQVQARASEQAPAAPVSSEDPTTTIDEPVSRPVEVGTAPPLAQAVVTPITKAEPQESLAKRLVAQRAVIIGEHVHRSRFQHSALVEKFQELKISDKTASTLAEAKAESLSTTNPFGPPKPAPSQQSAAGPSLPAHLAHLAPVTDADAAVRAQYGSSNPPTRDRGAANAWAGPSLPAHLASLPPVTDAGAATRAQYDPTAATSRGRGILNPGSNGQLRSFPSTDSVPSTTSSAPLSRTSMLNRTGFIGLAESRAQAKKGDDPLLVASKRGM